MFAAMRAPTPAEPAMSNVHATSDTPADAFVASSGAFSDDHELSEAAVGRAAVRLLPFLLLLYVCAYIDRVNVGIASLQMNRDLQLSAAAYGFGSSIFFVGYAFLEVPSNLILARVGARRWIARIMITWGLLAAGMMFARGTATFYTLRFLLGAAEGGFFPGIVFYLAGFFPANYRARAVSRFMLAIPVANVLSGLLAGPLLGLQGTFGLAGWQWLFLLEGLPAALLGVVVLLILPEAPADARWLSLPQRAALDRRLLVERDETHRHGIAGIRAALINVRVWQLGLIWAAMYLVANGYTFWAPQLIQHAFGRSAGWTGNVLAAISLAGGVAMFLSGGHSDRTGERKLHIAVPFGLGAIAWLLVASPLPAIWRLVGLALAAISIPCLYGPFWCVPSIFLSGEAAAGGLALISSIGALGGFVGPNVIGMAQRVTGSQQGGFIVLASVAALGAIMALLLENVQRPAAVIERQWLDRPGNRQR
jgi:MFS transporter, ACS family, tartrate transporter